MIIINEQNEIQVSPDCGENLGAIFSRGCVLSPDSGSWSGMLARKLIGKNQRALMNSTRLFSSSNTRILKNEIEALIEVKEAVTSV